MATRSAFLVRALRILAIFLSVIALLAPAGALPPSGGGHSGGGHSGGGHSGGGHSSGRHSGGSHAGGHFGWLHFGLGRHSARHAEFAASSTPDTVPHLASGLWSFSRPGRRPSIARTPPTLLWSPALFQIRPDGRVSFASSHVRRHHRGFRNRLPCFSSSGCFFDGMTEVCFFEPWLPLLSFSGDFDPFDSGFGVGGDLLDLGGDSQGPTQLEMSAIAPHANAWDDDTGNSPARPEPTPGAATEDRDLGKGIFVLVVKNGTSRAVTDYWVADGYLEYTSPDGTRSHIPLEALDLQSTVVRNAPRGLPFVLRNTPTQNR